MTVNEMIRFAAATGGECLPPVGTLSTFTAGALAIENSTIFADTKSGEVRHECRMQVFGVGICKVKLRSPIQANMNRYVTVEYISPFDVQAVYEPETMTICERFQLAFDNHDSELFKQCIEELDGNHPGTCTMG